MNPRRVKDLLPEISQKHSIDPKLLSDLNDFYWKRIHQALTNLESLHIMIPGLGTFNTRRQKLFKLFQHYGYLIANAPSPKNKKMTGIYMKNKEIHEQLRKLTELDQVEYHRKQEIKQLRKSIRNARENMEQPEADSGGTSEQAIYPGGSREDSQAAE